MKSKMMYIENKSNGHSGDAWIGYVEYSKSRQTLYFNNQALKKLKTKGIIGNYFDIETGDEYWISGVKKNGKDRHKNGNGKIMIDKKVVEEYLKLIDAEKVEERKFNVVELIETNRSRFNEIENVEI